VSPHRPAERLPGFTYRGRTRVAARPELELHADAIPLGRLAKRYGTPLYVYSASTIRQRYEQFDQAFRGCDHTICYSIKANSNLSVLKMLARLGAGFDIVSGGELQRVMAVTPKVAAKVVFSGVGKRAEELDQALQAGILMFNVESNSELELLAARAAHHRRSAQFAIRVNPQVAAKTHPYISTGLHQHKFGVPWRDATELYRRGARERYLKPAGVSVHIGSQICEMSPFRETMERTASLVQSLRADSLDIRYVDAGGGLGISYDGKGLPENFSSQARRYAKAVLGPLRKLGVHLLLEPGRAIVGPAGILLTRVLYRKRNNGKQFVVVDAAMNDLLRPSLYDAYHEIVPVVLPTRPTTKGRVDVVGPVCETGDFFARDRMIRDAPEGALLAILDTGAYGMALASNYNTRPRPAEALVDGARSQLIRRRESITEILAPERL
jgi:diaminopimelate decarboxylase